MISPNRIICVLAIATALLISGCASRPQIREFNVRNFGARGDGASLDSAAIQKAIDRCAQYGCGTVLLPPGIYLSKPIFLHDNVCVKLERGAILQATSEFSDYAPLDEPGPGLVNADAVTNVSIIGHGIIDGGGAPWWPAAREAKRTNSREPRRRPKMVNFHNCRNITVRNITLRNAPSFHLVPVDCENVLIDHVTITAPGNSPNTDAIDPSACKNVRIVNCLLDVGDDNVAIKAGHVVRGRRFCCEDIIVSNCVCLHGHGVSIGSETSGGVSNFVVVNCRFDGTVSGIRIKTTRSKGGPVENIIYKNLTMHNVTRPIDIACYYPRIPAEDTAQAIGPLTPFYREIHIENLSGDGPAGAGLIVGLPESPVRDITLANVHLKTETGLLIRNAREVKMQNVNIEVKSGMPLVTENAR